MKKIKKVLNWRHLRAVSDSTGTSVYLLAKREMAYRKSQEKDKGCNCCNCRASDKIKYNDGCRIQCAWIGIIKDFYANVDSKHICNFYEKAQEKNLDDKECQYDSDI